MKSLLASLMALTLISCITQTIEPDDDVSDKMEDFIIVDKPMEGDNASCPLHVSGEARGYWYFEAVFPFELLTESGELISSGTVTALDEWMTEDYVPFEFDLFYDTPEESGVLVLKRSNASGLPEYEMQIEIAVQLSTCTEEALLEHKHSLVEKYIRNNIVELSPVEAVLGGTWYVLEVEFLEGERVHVTYEDGHIQESFSASYSLEKNGDVVLSF